ncbi:MAG TPA: imidazolonepropionase [Marmoricola sp.]|nr:imidazolonepropionase [Nocardioidaceae bacterium]MCO5324463.1 imidazolonepropionase [Nocardioidaceae bacterium]HRV69999.1 imidazolonepropionase [Marmoricola sp.]
MSSLLITGISELTTVDVEARVLGDAAVVIEAETIKWIGSAKAAPTTDRRVDIGGRAMLPGWVDSHSHLVFAGDRAAEFVARMAGEPYAAGGIAVTVDATRTVGADQLRELVETRVWEALLGGTTCMETKTGYGLDVEHERQAAMLAEEFVDEVTFLGAHVVPDGISADDYVDLVCAEMLSAVAPHAGWIDVFCETGAFDVDQSRRVLEAGRAAGLGLRVHGNQLGHSGGVALAVEMGAASVDHCNYLSEGDIAALAQSDTVATVLPACDLSTRAPFAPARQLLDAGASIAIASNCNPGTSYTSSMNFCVATAVLQMGLTLDEAVAAATRGGARALRRSDVGQIAVGSRADLHVLDAPSATHLAYRPGMPLSWAVWRAGVPYGIEIPGH